MDVKASSSVRRNLFVALLVLMTLLPVVAYVYLRERGSALAAQRLASHVEQTVARAMAMTREVEPLVKRDGPASPEVGTAMERLVVNDNAIAYIQMVDRMARVVSSTSGAPARNRVPISVLPPASPEIAAPEVVGRRHGDDLVPPEFVIDLRGANLEPCHMVVGLSTKQLDAQLDEFVSPTRWSSVQFAVLCMAILAGFSAYIVYLTERSRALHAQLDAESRMAYIGTLAAGIAHEVRNPLSSMKMNVQMMEHRVDQLPPKHIEYFRSKTERIQGEVERLEQSVSHFLAFARPAPVRAERVSLNGVVDDVVELLRPQCQSQGVALACKLDRELPVVEIDPGQFVQAIENLVLNAMQAVGKGGAVTVSTQAADGKVVLAVADNGPGVPEDVQEKIFKVFFTTREGGTGLGLNIVSRIVEEHRGKLRLESELGKGSTFRIELPVPSSSAASEQAQETV